MKSKTSFNSFFPKNRSRGQFFFPKNRRGQITIFIIIGVVIIVGGILIYMFYPKVKTSGGFDAKNPSAFIQTCIEDEIKNNVALLSAQGGSLNPQFYYNYSDSKVEYLCYTNEDYKTCVMQQPTLKTHIESEIKNSVGNQSKECFDELQKNYEAKGEIVSLVPGDTSVELLPEKIVVTFNNVLTFAKAGSERYENFKVVLNNNLYELVGIANSILDWEARYGDADSSPYMNYYHWLKVEKPGGQTDGTTIYILTNRNNGNKFQFASRSVVWPSGYGSVA